MPNSNNRNKRPGSAGGSRSRPKGPHGGNNSSKSKGLTDQVLTSRVVRILARKAAVSPPPPSASPPPSSRAREHTEDGPGTGAEGDTEGDDDDEDEDEEGGGEEEPSDDAERTARRGKGAKGNKGKGKAGGAHGDDTLRNLVASQGGVAMAQDVVNLLRAQFSGEYRPKPDSVLVPAVEEVLRKVMGVKSPKPKPITVIDPDEKEAREIEKVHADKFNTLNSSLISAYRTTSPSVTRAASPGISLQPKTTAVTAIPPVPHKPGEALINANLPVAPQIVPQALHSLQSPLIEVSSQQKPLAPFPFSPAIPPNLLQRGTSPSSLAEASLLSAPPDRKRKHQEESAPVKSHLPKLRKQIRLKTKINGIPGHEQKPTSAVGGAGGFGNLEGEYIPVQATTPTVRYADVGGIEPVLQDVRELIEYPLTHPEIYQHLGVEPPRGILLHGPPGCGKTLLANAIAGELGVRFYNISAPEIVSGMSGESEAKIRSLFFEAASHAPCLVFIDEIDAITPKRDTAQREMERRIVAQLLTCLDGLSLSATNGAPVIVIGATNRPDALDPALRRAGRFDREIALGIPDLKARARILQVLSQKLRLSGDFNFELIATKTSGFIGADLAAVAKEAAVIAVHRCFEQLYGFTKTDTEKNSKPGTEGETSNSEKCSTCNKLMKECSCELLKRTAISDHLRSLVKPLSEQDLTGLFITMDDFLVAINKVQPSAKREGFSTIPDVAWKDVGAMQDIRSELTRSVVWPVRFPDLFKQMGIACPAGVLLFGPPGCGKTLIVKAVAHECGANFIGIKGPQLLNKYVGEAEKAVRQLFNRAQSSAPCIIFFDELDALCPRRSGESESTGASRVVNQLLTEMDGLESRRDVFVLAATNRPDVIDPAMLRPGRLDTIIAVDLPTQEGRADILRTITNSRRTPLAPSVDLNAISSDTRIQGFSGADLAALVKEASMFALIEALDTQGIILSTSSEGLPQMETHTIPMDVSTSTETPISTTPITPTPTPAPNPVPVPPPSPSIVTPTTTAAEPTLTTTQAETTIFPQQPNAPTTTPPECTMTATSTSTVTTPSLSPEASTTATTTTASESSGTSTTSSSTSTTITTGTVVTPTSAAIQDFKAPKVEMRHFDRALNKVTRSVSVQDERLYYRMKNHIHHNKMKVNKPEEEEKNPKEDS
ncbi:26S proteasome regulatory complex [Pelomyxa schiedti]|nr:26S proteasome regulatory complex [Pelomyxa schiedti]